MNSKDIADRIVEAILAQKLMPGTRLGEQALSMLFDCSRTLVREALMQLAARGIVQVSSRRGWFVVQPSKSEAREAFEARRVIETGEGDAGHILRKLLHLPRRLAPLSQRVACGVLHLPWGDQVPDARDRG